MKQLTNKQMQYIMSEMANNIIMWQRLQVVSLLAKS